MSVFLSLRCPRQALEWCLKCFIREIPLNSQAGKIMETKLLHGVPLFEPLSENEIQEVAAKMRILQVPKETVVLNEGEHSDSLYVVLSGKVKIFLVDEHGEAITLNVLGEGEYFGEVSLFDNGDRSASVIALNNSYFGVLGREDVLSLISKHPEMLRVIMTGTTSRIRDLSNNVRSLAANW